MAQLLEAGCLCGALRHVVELAAGVHSMRTLGCMRGAAGQIQSLAVTG